MVNTIGKFFILHYHFDKVAGTERVLFNIIRHLCTKENVEVTLVLLKTKHKLIFDIETLPVKIIFLDIDIDNPSKLKLIKNQFVIYHKLKFFFNSVNKDEKAVLLATNIYLALSVHLAKRTLKYNKLNVVSCEHFTVSATSKTTNFVRSLFYRSISVVMLTKFDRDFIDKKYQPIRTVCIPNAIPFEIVPYRANDNKTIIAIGRLTYQKGFDLLIKSFSLIADDFKEWKLLIIGDDYGQKSEMERLIDQNQVTNIHILPASSEINKYYEQASFYVMSSRFEGLPMVLLEALGYGLPIVSFNCPTGPAEVVDESNGFLVRDQDINALAIGMKKLMENQNLLLEKAKGSEVKALQYDKDIINKKWDDFFESI